MNIRSRAPALTCVLVLLAGCAHETGMHPVPSPPAKEGVIVVAAGDISCDPSSSNYNQGKGTAHGCRMLATSELAIGLKPAAVLLLGDNQYERGTLNAYQTSWVHNWGRKELRDITYPATGNHEYKTPGASGYFDFFGARAGERGKGFYSFNLGTWHMIAINSGGNDRCKPVSCAQEAEQELWLRKDLEENRSECILAFWHRPLFTSGLHRGATETRPFWRDLYEAGADVVLNGHSHQYERFAPQNPDGVFDPQRGITQFVVGTGGKNLRAFFRVQRNSVVRNAQSFGVLKLALREKSYSWEFISDSGQVQDSGSGQCHAKRPPITTKDAL